MSKADLAILGVYWNPLNQPRLRENFLTWRQNLPSDPAVQVWIVEITQPGQSRLLADGEHIVHFEHADHIWSMESARNVVVNNHITEADAVLCMDVDLVYSQQDWWRVMLNSLQKHPIIQAFKTGRWLDVHGKTEDMRRSLAWAFVHGNMGPWPKRLGTLHPGFAWAARRTLWEKVTPGLPDWLCTGPNDRALALACTEYAHPDLKGWWATRLQDYTAELQQWLGNDALGYAPLEVMHHWHGNLNHRMYQERNERLHQIMWPLHCRYNHAGLLSWTEEGKNLHEEWFRKLWINREDT